MKKIILILAVLLSVNFGISSQNATDSTKNNSIYLDLGGYTFWYSLNYEHKISLAPKHHIALGSGISVMPPTKNANILIGISANYLYGNKHNLEIGFAPSYNFTENEYLLSPNIGYRYQASKGFLFRVGLSPVYGDFFTNDANDNKKEFVPWGYISIGYSF